MIRLLLGIAALGCLLKVFIGVSHNVAFNKAIDATPVVMSINDIVGHPTSSLPKSLKVTGADLSETLCLQGLGSTKDDKGNMQCDELLIPLLTPAQEADASSGKDVTASIIANGSSAMVAKVNTDNHQVTADSVAGVAAPQGAVGSDFFANMGDGVSKLRSEHIDIDENTVYLNMKPHDDVSDDDGGFIVLTVILGGVALFLPQIQARRARRKKLAEVTEV
jgi:hypothetical protein